LTLTSNDCASKTVTTIETDSIATSGAVDLNLSGVRCKALRWILCRDAALEGEAASRDVILGETELFERCTRCDLDLGSDDIDAGHFLRNGMFDLNAGVDLYNNVSIWIWCAYGEDSTYL
jgi:hypothetical protein